jgi:hypothetical protein
MENCEDFIQTDCTETGLDCGLVTGFDGFLYIIDVRTHDVVKTIDFGEGESA